MEDNDVKVPLFTESDIPIISEEIVKETLRGLDINKSNVQGDIPNTILNFFADLLANPIAHVLNASIRQGCWPDILKMEIVTPVPKKFPPKTVEDLRNISGLLNLDKIAEKIISKMMVSDMKENIDPSQYANQKGKLIQHYLVSMIDRILGALDKNSKGDTCAVLATLVDWKQAFNRQCPKLGVESFIQNGVRPSLIPLMISYFQGRKMKVKWYGVVSAIRELYGGGPQGSTFGLWEYLSQSNDNADCVSESDRFKFVDDLSFLEIIHLLSVGIASYNIREHIPSNVATHNQVIPASNLKSQEQLTQINEWTKKKKMRLNEDKTKNIIFNFSKKYQFTTNLSVNEKEIELVEEVRLLGTIITKDLKWNKNTKELVRRGYQRMQLLNKAATFSSNIGDLKSIYQTYVRSVIEQSAVVWHSSLSMKNRKDLERVQKAAVRVILKNNYKSYKSGLKVLGLETLEDRRERICLRFAKNCLKDKKLKNLFPIRKSKHNMKKRKVKKFQTNKTNTKRYEKSSIPYMQKLLNKENDEKMQMMKD